MCELGEDLLERLDVPLLPGITQSLGGAVIHELLYGLDILPVELRFFEVLEAFNREELEFTVEEAGEVLERSEDQSNMQRLVGELAEDGELPEKSEFDLEEKVSEVIEEYPGAVEDYRDGQDSALNFFIGKIMEATNGKADAGEAREILIQELE